MQCLLWVGNRHSIEEWLVILYPIRLAECFDFGRVTIGNNTAFLPNAVASRNIGNSTVPTGNMDSATSATGLTGLTKVANMFHAGSLDNQSSHLRTTSNIIIPPGAALAVKVLTANATLGVTITWSMVEVEHE